MKKATLGLALALLAGCAATTEELAQSGHLQAVEGAVGRKLGHFPSWIDLEFSPFSDALVVLSWSFRPGCILQGLSRLGWVL